jgi:hypothetical protein
MACGSVPSSEKRDPIVVPVQEVSPGHHRPDGGLSRTQWKEPVKIRLMPIGNYTASFAGTECHAGSPETQQRFRRSLRVMIRTLYLPPDVAVAAPLPLTSRSPEECNTRTTSSR